MSRNSIFGVEACEFSEALGWALRKRSFQQGEDGTIVMTRSGNTVGAKYDELHHAWILQNTNWWWIQRGAQSVVQLAARRLENTMSGAEDMGSGFLEQIIWRVAFDSYSAWRHHRDECWEREKAKELNLSLQLFRLVYSIKGEGSEPRADRFREGFARQMLFTFRFEVVVAATVVCYELATHLGFVSPMIYRSGDNTFDLCHFGCNYINAWIHKMATSTDRSFSISCGSLTGIEDSWLEKGIILEAMRSLLDYYREAPYPHLVHLS